MRDSRRRGLAALSALGVVASLGAVAASSTPASAAAVKPKVSYVSLSAGVTKVTTSSHKKLLVDVDGFVSSASSPPSRDVTIDLNTPKFTESHRWYFPLSAKQVKLGKRGKITAPFGPYGSIAVTYKPAGKAHKQSCSSSDYTLTRPVKVTGKLNFNTRSKGKHKWGKFGSKHFHFHAGSVVTTEYGNGGFGCGHSTLSKCQSSIGYEASSSDSAVSVNGNFAGKRGYVSIERSVDLKAPSGATRSDSASAATGKPKLVKSSHNEASITVKAKKGTSASGSFSMSGSNSGLVGTLDCKKGKHKTTESEKDYAPAPYHAGHPPFSLKADIFGALRMPKSGGLGGFSLITP